MTTVALLYLATDSLKTKTHRKQETFMAILEIENKYREYIKDDRIQQR